ncbi:hypothetical protein TNCV_813051 [Trichonephila clavipes]|nr:hypothetical protein TNCV_813051 [Trichonephila clavipes]
MTSPFNSCSLIDKFRDTMYAEVPSKNTPRSYLWVNKLVRIASVFMVHRISYSIFEVGEEAIPVMPLREKMKTQESQFCWFLIEDDV